MYEPISSKIILKWGFSAINNYSGWLFTVYIYHHHQIFSECVPIGFFIIVCILLTLRLLMSYIYGAPSKARNANVLYRVSQEECEILRESVPYVELYQYNPKHLYPKLNGYGDNGQRKMWTSCISTYCTSTAVSPLTFKVQCSHPSQ